MQPATRTSVVTATRVRLALVSARVRKAFMVETDVRLVFAIYYLLSKAPIVRARSIRAYVLVLTSFVGNFLQKLSR